MEWRGSRPARRPRAVRVDGDWEGWLDFFLDGVTTIADEAVASARELFALVAADRSHALAREGMSVVALRLLELLPRHPTVTVASVIKLVETTKTTAGRAIDLLAAAGVLVGKTGVGKSYWALSWNRRPAARACVRCACAVPRPAHELAIARADGTYTALLTRLARLDVLALDDFLIAPLKDTERRDLLEVLEDRYGTSSTVVTSQVPTKNWLKLLADPTIADAMDRPEYAA